MSLLQVRRLAAVVPPAQMPALLYRALPTLLKPLLRHALGARAPSPTVQFPGA